MRIAKAVLAEESEEEDEDKDDEEDEDDAGTLPLIARFHAWGEFNLPIIITFWGNAKHKLHMFRPSGC